MVFFTGRGKALRGLFVEDLGVSMIVLRYGRDHFCHMGFSNLLHTLFSTLISCCLDADWVPFQRVIGPVDVRVELAEPRMTQDESILS